MVFICDKCKFLFDKDRQPDTCPDCGSSHIRNANDEEIKEYEHNKKTSEQEEW